MKSLSEFLTEAAGENISKSTPGAKRQQFATELWNGLNLKQIYKNLMDESDFSQCISNLLVGMVEGFPDNIRSIGPKMFSLQEVNGEPALVFDNGARGKELWYLDPLEVNINDMWKKLGNFNVKVAKGFTWGGHGWVDDKGNSVGAKGSRFYQHMR